DRELYPAVLDGGPAVLGEVGDLADANPLRLAIGGVRFVTPPRRAIGCLLLRGTLACASGLWARLLPPNLHELHAVLRPIGGAALVALGDNLDPGFRLVGIDELAEELAALGIVY